VEVSWDSAEEMAWESDAALTQMMQADQKELVPIFLSKIKKNNHRLGVLFGFELDFFSVLWFFSSELS